MRDARNNVGKHSGPNFGWTGLGRDIEAGLQNVILKEELPQFAKALN